MSIEEDETKTSKMVPVKDETTVTTGTPQTDDPQKHTTTNQKASEPTTIKAATAVSETEDKAAEAETRHNTGESSTTEVATAVSKTDDKVVEKETGVIEEKIVVQHNECSNCAMCKAHAEQCVIIQDPNPKDILMGRGK